MKTTLVRDFSPSGQPELNSLTISQVGEVVEQLRLSHDAVGSVKRRNHLETQFGRIL